MLSEKWRVSKKGSGVWVRWFDKAMEPCYAFSGLLLAQMARAEFAGWNSKALRIRRLEVKP